MIDGVMVKQLRVIPDERGRLMEILREDDDIYMRFGQVYLTTGTRASSRRGTTTRSSSTTSAWSRG